MRIIAFKLQVLQAVHFQQEAFFAQAEWFTKAVLTHVKSLLWENPGAVYKFGLKFPTSGLCHDAILVAAKSKLAVTQSFAGCIQNGNLGDQTYFIFFCALQKKLHEARPDY